MHVCCQSYPVLSGRHRCRARYEAAGRLADLEEAISAARQAVHATAPDHGARGPPAVNPRIRPAPAVRAHWPPARSGRSYRSRRPGTMLTPDDDPNRGRLQSNLGSPCGELYEHADDPADLRKAADLAKQAVARTPLDRPDRTAMMMSNLAVALFQTVRVRPGRGPRPRHNRCPCSARPYAR